MKDTHQRQNEENQYRHYDKNRKTSWKQVTRTLVDIQSLYKHANQSLIRQIVKKFDKTNKY